jgi:hypothetical protein
MIHGRNKAEVRRGCFRIYTVIAIVVSVMIIGALYSEWITDNQTHNMRILKNLAAIIVMVWTIPFILHLVIEWIVVGFMKG